MKRWSYAAMELDSELTTRYATQRDMVKARAYAHSFGQYRGWKFETKVVSRMTLRVRRIA